MKKTLKALKKPAFIFLMTLAGILFNTTATAQTWMQMGTDIDGEAAGDLSGTVSMPDANTVAIGAPYNDENGVEAGQVRIYNWNGNNWIQKGMDIEGETAGDLSGYSLSMPDANTIAIAAILNDESGANAGQVQVYSWNGSSWIQKGESLNGETADDRSGISISMPDANTVAIGAHLNDGSGTDAGHVRVYTWNGSSWVQKGADIDGEAAGDLSGLSVSMPDANTVAIGAPGNDGNGTDAGHVRVYTWNGSSWVQKGMDIDGEAADDRSGGSISMPDANTVAIGAILNDGNGANAGHARVYTWNGSSWVQKGMDIDGEAADDRSGGSISMPDANTVAIGAYFNSGNGTEAGHVRVYSFSCNTTFSSFSVTACHSYTVPSGDETYTTSGAYLDTIPNAAGCDSLMVITVTINTVDTSITNDSPTLTANATGASYQWLDCNNGNAPIPGETNQSFTATTSGSYAVEITQNGCTDTSSCTTVILLGLLENSFGGALRIHPNPGSGYFSIDLGTILPSVAASIFDLSGRLINRHIYRQTRIIELELNQPAGIYLVRLEAGSREALIRLMKE